MLNKFIRGMIAANNSVTRISRFVDFRNQVERWGASEEIEEKEYVMLG